MIALLGGPIFAFLGYQEKNEIAAIQTTGITVPAVIDGGETRTKKGTTSFKLDVIYKTQTGQVVTKRFSAPSAYVEQHVRNDTIVDDAAQVRYLPDDPERAVLIGAEGDPTTQIYVGSGGFVLGAILSFFLFRRKPAPAA